VHFDPPKSTLLEDYILTPRKCCTIKYVHTLENDRSLLAHTPLVVGVLNDFLAMKVQNLT